MLHIALLPWLAFGHLLPFLHLAIALANAGLRISYFSTPRNIRRLPIDVIPPHLSSQITFINLSLPLINGLPETCEATVDVAAPEEYPLFLKAFDSLQEQLKNFLVGDDKPDYLIYDVMAYWAPDVAVEASVPRIVFSIFASSSLAFNGWPPEGADTEEEVVVRMWWPSPESMMSTPEWITFPTNMVFRRWEAEGFYKGFFGSSDSDVRTVTRYVRSVKGSSGAIAVRCCREFNAEFLDALQNVIGKTVIPVGWLPPSLLPVTQVKSRVEALEWLDGRPARSVVFVSFGSEYKMNRVEVSELAHGLELSNMNFLWLLRRPAWLADEEDDEKALPEGFRGRTQDRGLVSFGWAPQLRILAHKAIGGTLFHAGCSSVIESLSYGLVLVLLPGVIDQGLIARRLVEKGLGIEVERDEGDGSFDRNGIAEALRIAMASDETERLREKAGKMRAILGDQTVHDEYIKVLVDFMAKSANKNV